MKLVDVAEFYTPRPTGVRTYIDAKIAAAAALGHEVVVVAPGRGRATERRAGGRIEWVPSQTLIADKNYRLFWNFKPVHAILDAERPDVVEASSPWTAAWIVAAWRGDAPRAHFLHADPVASYPYRWFAGLLSHKQVDVLFAWFWAHLRALDRRFDTTVVSGEWLAARMRAHGLSRLSVAPLGVELGAFTPGARDEALRAALLDKCGLPPGAPLLLGVGRLHPEKRWPFLMRATGRAARPVGLAIAGGGLRAEEIARAAARHPHVHLIGPVTDRARMAALLASADGFIHGGGSETFGLTTAEAMASGTPVIVPDTGGTAELARPAFAETFRAGDLAAAVAAIDRFLARDRAAMGRAAALAASRLGTPADHFARLFDLYRELAGRPRLRGREVSVAAEPPLVGEGAYRAA